jgi:hypothetical protein
MVAITLQDSLEAQMVDEDFDTTLTKLNKAGASSHGFVRLDDVGGGDVLVNIENILMLQEVYNEAEED